MIYLFTFLIIAVLTFRYDINGKKRYRDFCYFCILVLFVLIAGLRYRLGVDTTSYIFSFYHRIPDLQHISDMEDTMFAEPCFYFLCSFVKSIGGKFYHLQLIHAAFVNILLFFYIKKHSQYIYMCVLFYFLWAYTAYMMEEMRASMAVVLCFYGNDYMLERKWGKGLLLYAFAFLCHNSAILLVVTPFLLFLRFNFWGFVLLSFVPVIEFYIQYQFEDYLLLASIEADVTNKASSYLSSERYLAEHNIFYYLINIVTLVFYSLLAFVKIKKENNIKLLNLQPIVIIGLMFVIMQNNSGIFYRYVSFYKIYFIFYFVEFVILSLNKQDNLSEGVKIFRILVICVPLLYSMVGKYKESYIRYYPYSSIFDKSVDQKREKEYRNLRTDIELIIRENEY